MLALSLILASGKIRIQHEDDIDETYSIEGCQQMLMDFRVHGHTK